MDLGRKGTEKRAEIYAYNGGLFKPDNILDALEIDNDLLHKYALKLSNYDFESQVDVNILGHIFENSLNEIESINAEIEGGDFDKQKSKRKKDGVFYTPKYITKYIVENTVGKLCEEKKIELGFKEEEYFKGRAKRPKKKITELVQLLDDYREWLLQLTICDPACGSGAFLNQALDFLIKEHHYIDELKAKILGGAITFSDIETTILENNIYGVDLNEESVEIAKLSLWLRTAQPRRKLNDLSSNIKCGNSLIESKSVAKDKAFKWESEFSKVFDNGGFNVIIGNPPYVRLQNIDSTSREYFNTHYKTSFKNYDLYVLFVEKLKTLLHKSGVACYIMPKKFVTTEYGIRLKEFLYEENMLETFVDFSDFQIFKDATTYTGIFSFTKHAKKLFRYLKLKEDIPNTLKDNNTEEINYSNISSSNWIFLNGVSASLYDKLSELRKLKELSQSLYVGLQTSADPVFILEIVGDKLYSKFTKKYYDFNSSKIIKPLLKGAEIKRYTTPTPKFKLIFPYRVSSDNFSLFTKEEMQKYFPLVWDYLTECRDKLEGRESGKMKNDSWYGYVYLKNMTEFSKPKILTQVLSKRSSLTMDLHNNFHFVGGGTAGGYGIKITEDINEFLLISILNSKLIQWFIKQIASPFQGGYYAYNKGTLGECPLPKNIVSSSGIEEKLVVLINSLNDEMHKQEINFLNFFSSKYNLYNPSKKLQNWQILDFGDFIKELNKAIKTTNKYREKEAVIDLEEGQKEVTSYEVILPLSKKDEFEWMELFEENKNKIEELQTQINQTEKEIDAMVYELYGLTDEEIRIVEEA